MTLSLLLQWGNERPSSEASECMPLFLSLLSHLLLFHPPPSSPIDAIAATLASTRAPPSFDPTASSSAWLPSSSWPFSALSASTLQA
ncbi:hypothetical protein FA10DRAFT_170766 [Acaromyces ingoldii]|uniref:Uncharacterized protein n=1 Tax=Acaromyces ingoldii TaxID=215250 RepID=A0A316YHN5_9BASI|nr:hypothetical protein FA10DRAFT_170766 [Acaromyces ingoldii]PWN88682.1 hypothetical protein FA10DRAFT_170766 [Acaromyces ingoldii]